ncbi:hypothetical protein [Paraliomyxa miuraensis]|uniref:hypothetical protein n=1 Tax=Paraliomyxa miuraensis TaxID=376150 RepID=UPI002253320F|nr:hypothetical protein [Paraliomyxa miuraensis]MCX4245740.1 hypothetical protein [Paraliomyxa miuraensis]
MKPSRTPFLALSLLSSLALLSGCYGDVESFAKTTAKHSCKRLAECQRADFEDRYGGDLERCRDETYTDFLNAYDIAQDFNCEYDPDEGKACGSTIKSLRGDCSDEADQDINDACEEIFDCPIGLVPDDSPTPGQLAAEALASFPPEDDEP